MNNHRQFFWLHATMLPAVAASHIWFVGHFRLQAILPRTRSSYENEAFHCITYFFFFVLFRSLPRHGVSRRFPLLPTFSLCPEPIHVSLAVCLVLRINKNKMAIKCGHREPNKKRLYKKKVLFIRIYISKQIWNYYIIFIQIPSFPLSSLPVVLKLL